MRLWPYLQELHPEGYWSRCETYLGRCLHSYCACERCFQFCYGGLDHRQRAVAPRILDPSCNVSRLLRLSYQTLRSGKFRLPLARHRTGTVQSCSCANLGHEPSSCRASSYFLMCRKVLQLRVVDRGDRPWQGFWSCPPLQNRQTDSF